MNIEMERKNMIFKFLIILQLRKWALHYIQHTITPGENVIKMWSPVPLFTFSLDHFQ